MRNSVKILSLLLSLVMVFSLASCGESETASTNANLDSSVNESDVNSNVESDTVTENGCSCENDDFRIIYITEYLASLSAAIKDGIDVRGFLYWSFLDNWEWGSFVPTFGLVGVDRENDFKRTVKPSAYFYKEIIENNGFNQEILRKYLKEIPRTKY